MKTYESKDLTQFLFVIRKSDTLSRLAPFILFLILYSVGIAYLELEYFQFKSDSWLRNLPVMHTLLSFVISMLLVFRTNTAYDRWWEGRKLWGSLVNTSRNFAIKLDAILPVKDMENRNFFRKAIPLYAYALKDHLQSKQTKYSLDESGISSSEIIPMDFNKHVPNQVAKQLFARLHQLHISGQINGDQLIILNGEVSSFTDICGACERILNTPIPYSYSAFIKKFIMLYTLTLPIGYSFTLGYLAAPIVGFVFYVLASLELIAEEIEEPFGTDANDLPMDKMSENIDRHVGEIFE
ncbi:bestrophin family protein [Algoriphagus mannitolivorans]|uniref:bestrophin family protein n=1 Tax=Algoriphagus mannitolivorans TaxID=226504 RepID=UPI0003F89FBE|nr:bestrophin family protein [Algoriphagus mannitolivorans]